MIQIALSKLTRTKTIATVGPACASLDQLKQLLVEGVDVFRLNMAHGERQQHRQVVADIRRASLETQVPAGILVDLAGPKIRLGELHTNPLNLDIGLNVFFVRGNQPINAYELVCSYPRLLDEVAPGDQIMLSDGSVRLEVESNDGQRLSCQVIEGGEIRSRQGVNLPGVNLGVAPLRDADKSNAGWAAENNIEFISLSFVRRAEEIRELRRLLDAAKSRALLVAKIEKREALEQLEEIIDASDAVMVARGDLGVEIEIEKTPLAQKRIIKTCQRMGKPVIVATQMLESMHHSRQPTRAEVSDVANAILDGADACMLSGETAIGQFPVQAVAMMQKIKFETEQILAGRPSRLVAPELIEKQGISGAVVYGAAQIARRIQAKMVVIATAEGQAALVKSKQRDFIPTIAVTNRQDVLNRMCLYWGITPVYMESLDGSTLRQWIHQWTTEGNILNNGDRVVLVLDTEVWPGVNDTVHVVEIG